MCENADSSVVIHSRAAAGRCKDAVEEVVRRIAARHDLELNAGSVEVAASHPEIEREAFALRFEPRA